MAVKELKNLAKAVSAIKSGALEFTNKYKDLVIKAPDGSQVSKIGGKLPEFDGMPIRVADFSRVLKTLLRFNAPVSLSVNGHGIRFELERQDMTCSVVVPAFRNKKFATELNAQ